MDRIFNFRDLGGHTTTDGRIVHYRRLYRSDSLHRLSAAQCTSLTAIGVRTVLDLRRPREIDAQGRVSETAGFTYHNIHPLHREWTSTPYDESIGPARYLADRYLDMTEEGVNGFGEALRLIAQPGTSALVMHCFAGKDRTGVLTALTLSLLGVAAETIAADYGASASAQPSLTAAITADAPELAAATPAHHMVCPPQAMMLFLADLTARYGSVLGYAAHAGITRADIAALRNHLLTSAMTE